jgi:NADH-quinone oxidoreductase subunit M
MNFVVLGLFSFARAGLDGAIYLMVAHGITSTALFFCIGVLYDSTHTRLVYYYGGLGAVAPVFASAFFVFTFGNMGFPGTPGFIGEFLTLAGILQQSIVVAVFAATSVVTSAAYGTLLANRVLFGTVKTVYISGYIDANRLQVYTLAGLVVSSVITGLCAAAVLPYATQTVSELLSYYTPR